MRRPDLAALPAAASAAPEAGFWAGLAGFGGGEILIVAHNDADGLAASAILARGLAWRGCRTAVRNMGRGGSSWSDGSGHCRVTGGALRPPGWNAFVRAIGFGPEMEVPA